MIGLSNSLSNTILDTTTFCPRNKCRVSTGPNCIWCIGGNGQKYDHSIIKIKPFNSGIILSRATQKCAWQPPNYFYLLPIVSIKQLDLKPSDKSAEILNMWLSRDGIEDSFWLKPGEIEENKVSLPAGRKHWSEAKHLEKFGILSQIFCDWHQECS